MKNKYILFTIMALCCASVLSAQTVPSKTKDIQESEYMPMLVAGNQWNNLFMPTVGSEYYYEHTYISKLGEDTIIEGVTYFKFLTAYDENSSIWETVGFLREDVENRKVYVKRLDNPEALLYDFNANVGDTISTYNFHFYPQEVLLVIQNIESISIGGELRKKMTVLSISADILGHNYRVWIEGIGCPEDGLLSAVDPADLVGSGLLLLCFSQEEVLIYKPEMFENRDCFVWTYPQNIKENSSTSYKVWQANGNLHINSEKQIPCSVELFDISGRLLQHTKTDNGNVIIDINNYTAGVHIVRITSNNSVSNHKVLITK